MPLSVGEFARAARLSASAVRFYVDAGLLECQVDPANSYRWFAEDQLERAVLLRKLRVLGMPLASAREVLTADPGEARALVDEHWRQLQESQAQAQSALTWVQHHLDRESPMTSTCTIERDAFQQALHQVLPAVASDPKESPVLKGVLFSLTADGLELAATDKHRLAVRHLVPDEVVGSDATVVLDAAPLRQLPEGGRHLVLDLGPEGARITSGDITSDVPAVAGSFPDHHLFLDRYADSGRRIGVLLADVVEALEHLGDEPFVSIETSEGTMTVADAERTQPRALRCVDDGEPLSLTINPTYLLEALGGAMGPDVVIRFTSPTEPVVVTSADDGTFTCMVMPVRVRGR